MQCLSMLNIKSRYNKHVIQRERSERGIQVIKTKVDHSFQCNA